jgi:serine/threonine protein kinase/WD40 repeat protein
MSVCPSIATLDRAFTALLQDDPADPSIIAHVEACGRCQSRLEALVAYRVEPLLKEKQGQGQRRSRVRARGRLTDIHDTLVSGLEFIEQAEADPVPLPEVPGYEILEQLDRGGMGVVYKARHQRLNRLVALKMILAGEYAGPDRLNRFYREAEAVARLRHPNIVEIYDIGMASHMPYIALEYLAGGSLEQLFRQGPLPPHRSAELLATLAQAIHTAHLAGIVHRDLKPANVLLAEEGTPKITDFGLAKRCEAPGQTESGQIMGTPAYMAPEQARGESKSVGPTADVYALGAILFEALTGQPLFHGDTVIQTLQKVLRDEPLSPRHLVPGVPTDLDTVCLKALSKEPEDRYQTAQELADELDRFLHDEPVRARPLSRTEKVYRWCLRYPTRAGLLAVSAALVLMATLASLLGFYHVQLRYQHQRTAEALAGEQEARRNEQRTGYVTDIYVAERLFHENELERVRELLVGTAADQRGWEWHYLDRVSSADDSRYTGHTQPVHTLAFAPQQSLLVSGSGDGTLVFWHPGDPHRLLKLPANSGPVWGLAFSPDGKQLAGVTGSARERGALIVWDPGTEPKRKPRQLTRTVLSTPLGEHAALAYHPSKPLLAVASGTRGDRPGCLLLLDEAGKELRRWSGSADQGCVALAWSPDGRYLAASFVPARPAAAPGTVLVVDPNRPQPLYRFEANGGQALALAFSPDGRTLASGGADRMIELRGVEDFTLRRMCCGHTGAVTSVAFAGEGRLVSGGTDTTVRIWDDASGEERNVCRGHIGPVRCMAVQPGTGLVYSGSDDITIKAWRPDRSQGCEAYRLHHGAATAVAFSPDGATLISVGLDGAVWRIDPTGKERPRRLLQERRPLRQVRFWPTGQTFLVAGGDEEAGHADGTIRLVDAGTGRVSGELDTQLALVSSLSVSDDGRRLSVVGRTAQHDSVVQIWDMTCWPPREVIPNRPDLLPGNAVAAQVSPEGNRLVVLLPQNGFLHPSYVLFDLSSSPSPMPGMRLPMNSPSFAVFSRDESLLFLGEANQGFYKLRVGRNGLSNLGRYSGHARAIRSGALNPEETLLATASEDETIRLWDLQTNRELLVLRGDASAMNDVAFSPRGGFLAAAQASGTIRVWDGRPQPGTSSSSVFPR